MYKYFIIITLGIYSNVKCPQDKKDCMVNHLEYSEQRTKNDYSDRKKAFLEYEFLINMNKKGFTIDGTTEIISVKIDSVSTK